MPTAVARRHRSLSADPRRRYQARGAALALWADRRPSVGLSGPAGTGKSRACLEKLDACCERWPGTRAMIVRKTRASLTDSALVTYEDKVLPEGSPICSGPRREHRHIYRYPNGSEVVVGGLDRPSRVMSTEFDLIYVQEAIELAEGDVEALESRLRNGVMPFQQMVYDTNPDGPEHWLRRRADRGTTALLESRHEDNPTLWDADRGDWTERGKAYIARLDALTGVRKERLRFGRWVQAEGVVYEGYDAAVHLIDRFEIPHDWRRVRACDFGWTNPFVMQLWAIDHDGRMYLDREVYRTQRTVADHAAEVRDRLSPEPVEATVADHDAEDRATLHAAGIWTVPAYKAISPGLQAVAERLRPAGDGKPRLFLFRDALIDRDESLAARGRPCCTAEEFPRYAWPKGQDGRPVKETPFDIDNHGMDALRYAVAYVDGLGYGPARAGADPLAGWRG
jgi:PBSX family phage terminase large subunit